MQYSLATAVVATTIAFAQAQAQFAPLSHKDSLRALGTARKAQNDFEVVRRRFLPRQEGLSNGACDVVVGRFCYRQGASSGPPREAERVVSARQRLLQLLDSLSRLLPNDRWIFAQRVRYELEAGRPDVSFELASSCAEHAAVPETRHWCRTLMGYVAQRQGDYVRADSAFSSALAQMPMEERCEFQDLSPLLEGDAARAYRRLSCAARDSMTASLWRLVQPLYLIGVNDLRTEYLARVTRARIEEDTRIPLGSAPSDDDREGLLRYGGSLWYTQEDAPAGSSRPSVVAGHARGPAFNFFPLAKGLLSPGELRVSDWQFDGVTARTRYAPEWAAHFLGLLDQQVAVFRRGDSAFIVAAFDATDDGLFTGTDLTAGIFAAGLELGGVGSPTGRTIPNPGPATVTTLRVPWRAMIVSLEVLDRSNHAAGRARFSVKLPPPGARLAMSDLLLFAPRDSTPTALDAALPLALSSLRVPRNRKLGLFWETYGARPQAEPLDYALRVEPVGQGWFHRAFIRLKLKEKDSALNVQWREVAEVTDGVASRGLAVDLESLKPGHYRVRLALSSGVSEPIVAEREIEILR